MTKALAILAPFILAFTASDPPPVTGWASYYDQQPTDATIAARLEMGHITHADLLWAETLIAVADCSTIGDRVTVQVGDDTLLRAVVFDCAGDVDTVEWMEQSNVVLELDFYTAERYGMVESGAVRVKVWE